MLTLTMIQVKNLEEFQRVFTNDLLSIDTTEYGISVYPPNCKDLYSLYTRARNSKTLAVLEFGSGWSTFAFELALRENMHNFLSGGQPKIRHPNPFQLMTIDCSSDFLNLALKRIAPSDIRINSIVTQARMAEVGGKICTLYNNFPAFTADLIYLDGPDCDSSQVSGDIDGFNLNFGSEGRVYGLPMAGDLIRVESFLWPGTEIVTDGRGANANFLKDNFRRNWVHSYSSEVDQHVLFLNEPAWGSHSSALLRLKELNSAT